MGSNEKCSWHDDKREDTYRRRGIDFADLSPFFEDAQAVVREDDRYNYGEARYNMLASYEGIILNITFTPRGELFHIISARIANRKERKVYAKDQASA